MAGFLESGKLHSADEATRKLFWTWLRWNERRITPRERPKLADIPIWRKAHMAIRRTATDREVMDWLNDRLTHFQMGVTRNARTSSALARFEADLATLLQDTGSARALKSADITLPALAQDCSIRERATLVMPSRAVERLALPSQFLLKHKRRAALLDHLSPVLTVPTVRMLLDAFAEDGGNFDALQARLQQFVSLTEPDDDYRTQLADVPIIPVHGRPFPPSRLAFTGPKGDYWGAWKTRLSGKGLSQEDQRRYRAAGVTSASPDKETSRAFFEWLSEQDESVLQRHVPCVLRHILHRDGPTHWAKIFTDIPFIPARGRDGVLLVSLRSAQRRPVYLPDAEDVAQAIIQRDPAVSFVIDHVKEVAEPIREPLRNLGISKIFTDIPFIPARGRDGVLLVSLRSAQRRPVYLPDAEDVAQAIIQRDPAVSFVIDHVKEVAEPIREPLRNLGIRSLREALEQPESVSGAGETAPAEGEVVEQLRALRSHHFRRTFLKRLATLGVEPDLVWHDWHDRLSRIREIRFADTVEAHYLFRGRLYPVQADGGFDPESGTFWMKNDRGVGLSSLYEAIAAQLVFKSSARPVHCLALERALELEIRDPSYGRPHGRAPDQADLDHAADTEGADARAESGDEGNGGDADPGEAVFGHAPFEPDPSRAPSRLSGRGDSTSGSYGGHSETKPAPELEQEHIEALKRSHYASHCQMCLCERTPRELAPPGSYIQWEEVRRRVVEAQRTTSISNQPAARAMPAT